MRVLAIGCGFMGLMLLQGLPHSFAEQVIAVDIVQERLDLARSLGVEEVYNLSARGCLPALAPALKKTRQIDVVVNSSGSQASLDLATDVVTHGGIINLFGWLKGQTATFDPTKWHLGGFTVVNSSPSLELPRPVSPLQFNCCTKASSISSRLSPTWQHLRVQDLMKKILSGDKSYLKGVIKLTD